MKLHICLLVVFSAFFDPCISYAYATTDILPLDDALRATYTACIGIDDEMQHLKTMAGINTAVTAVGTAAGIGATVTGFVKANKDELIEKLEMEKLRRIEESGINSAHINPVKNNVLSNIDNAKVSYMANADPNEIQTEIDQLTKQSKNLGNWRTGLLAANTATNIAGAAIAGTNKVDKDLEAQIKSCVSAVDTLRKSMMQARMEGTDITEAQSIADACGDYEFVDVSKINKRATGAMASSIVGAATGLAGTVVSGVANSEQVRNDNSAAGKKKEQDMNMAANVLSIGATAASASATIFNATQIAAIKKVAVVSEKCTGILK